MKRIAIIGALALAGCSHTEPGVKVVVQKVPTPVPCLPRDEIPDEPAPVGDKLTGNPVLDLPIVVASALELRAVVKATRGALVACAG